MEKMIRSIFHYPFNVLNPFQANLINGLKRKGLPVIGVDEAGFKGLIKISRVQTASSGVLNLHWLHGHIVGHSPSNALLRALLLLGIAAWWRLAGGRLVWTVHNLKNHEQENRFIDRVLSIGICRLANIITVFGPRGKAAVSREFMISESKIAVARHARYFEGECFLPPRSMNINVRFLFFGLIRPYKGIDGLITSFRRAFSNRNHLKIVGAASDLNYIEYLKRLAYGQENLSIKIGWLEQAELIEELNFSDVVVLPFVDTFMSGSLIAAISAGRPLVVADLGLVRDYVDESIAFIFDPNDDHGLGNALLSAAHDSTRLSRFYRILSRSEELSQDAVANDWVSVYDKLN